MSRIEKFIQTENRSPGAEGGWCGEMGVTDKRDGVSLMGGDKNF